LIVIGNADARETMFRLHAAVLAVLASGLAIAQPSHSGSRAAHHAATAEPLLRSGTAFFVSAGGMMLTGAHVVKGCQHISIWPTNGPNVNALIVALDERLDLALLTTSARIDVATLAPWHSVAAAGTPVYTIGFGLTPSTPRVPVLTKGSIDGVAREAGRPILVLHARLYEGNSGGPVVDSRGRLEGIVIGRYSARPAFAVAVPTKEIATFLMSYGIALPVIRAGERTAIGPWQQLQRIAALVQCSDIIDHAEHRQ
jgi:S1-C subfamily serine protease